MDVVLFDDGSGESPFLQPGTSRRKAGRSRRVLFFIDSCYPCYPLAQTKTKRQGRIILETKIEIKRNHSSGLITASSAIVDA
jgi:hypothetical protein